MTFHTAPAGPPPPPRAQGALLDRIPTLPAAIGVVSVVAVFLGLVSGGGGSNESRANTTDAELCSAFREFNYQWNRSANDETVDTKPLSDAAKGHVDPGVRANGESLDRDGEFMSDQWYWDSTDAIVRTCGGY